MLDGNTLKGFPHGGACRWWSRGMQCSGGVSNMPLWRCANAYTTQNVWLSRPTGRVPHHAPQAGVGTCR